MIAIAGAANIICWPRRLTGGRAAGYVAGDNLSFLGPFKGWVSLWTIGAFVSSARIS